MVWCVVTFSFSFARAHICSVSAVSGGFANVHPNNKLTINAVEAAPLEDFSSEVLFFLVSVMFPINLLM